MQPNPDTLPDAQVKFHSDHAGSKMTGELCLLLLMRNRGSIALDDITNPGRVSDAHDPRAEMQYGDGDKKESDLRHET